MTDQSFMQSNRRTIIALILGVITMYVLVTWFVDQKLQSLETELEMQIATQQTTLVALSVITARNSADATVEAIIKDCSSAERNRFDTLLGSLGKNLTRAELLELDRLFGRCADFFASRKGLMVAKLERELEIYQALITQRQQLSATSDTLQQQIEDWQALVEAEKKLSNGFNELVSLQDEIIQALLAGETSLSPVISDLLANVSQVQDTLSVTNAQARTLRGKLVPADA